MATPDIGDFGTTLQLFDNTVQRGEPIAHQVIVIAGTEKAPHGAEEAALVIAPRRAPAGLEHCLDLILAFDHPLHQVKCPII